MPYGFGLGALICLRANDEEGSGWGNFLEGFGHVGTIDVRDIVNLPNKRQGQEWFVTCATRMVFEVND